MGNKCPASHGSSLVPVTQNTLLCIRFWYSATLLTKIVNTGLYWLHTGKRHTPAATSTERAKNEYRKQPHLHRAARTTTARRPGIQNKIQNATHWISQINRTRRKLRNARPIPPHSLYDQQITHRIRNPNQSNGRTSGTASHRPPLRIIWRFRGRNW